MITTTDIAEMIDLLTTAYGEKAFPVEDVTKMQKVVSLWSVMFADDDPREVLIAVKDCIATLQFPPKIADIKMRIANNRMAGQMTEMEAWAVIRKAVEDSDSREVAERIYESLPKILKRIVGSASQLRAWRTVEDEQFETVTASNCMRTYRNLAQHEAYYHALPSDMQQVESWRIDGKKQDALPAPETKKLIYEKPDWMIRREAEGWSLDDC